MIIIHKCLVLKPPPPLCAYIIVVPVCCRVQLILQGSLHCMTCGDGMGSVKFIQLPLPEVLLSGTQHLTVQAVIEQSFDIINVGISLDQHAILSLSLCLVSLFY